MVYVVLLRAINVGGRNALRMATLRAVCEALGCRQVTTYINSGNVVLVDDRDVAGLPRLLEDALREQAGCETRVLLIGEPDLRRIADAVPDDWTNDASMRCDVMFLWPGQDAAEVLDRMAPRAGVDRARAVPGAVIWNVERADVGRSALGNVAGTAVYKQLTIRNANTVRKLRSLAAAAAAAP